MSIKVLVADDSITIQKVIGIIFGGDEYSLTVVDNGKAAIDKAREINPDILLIDALMPGMTGYEVSEAVRSTPSLAAKPILILTGTFEPFDEEKAKKCGADDFIAKPFESQQIITKVKELLELGRSRAQLAQVQPPPLPATDFICEQEPDFSASIYDAPTPVADQAIEASQSLAQADIWSAFTTEEMEQPVEAATAPIAADFSAATIEPDVFAIVTEENDAQLVQSPTAATIPNHTASQWVPIEENTFEFEEDTIAEPFQSTFTEQEIPVQEPSFGDIAFEDEVETPVVPVISAVHEPEYAEFAAPATFAPLSAPATPFAPLADPTPALATPVEPPQAATVPAATLLSEDQLRAALSNVSKEVIERIVWEIVPDLAEAMIREAIRKIKEGA